MSASELLQRLRSMPAGAELDWAGIRHEVTTEYDHATPADRATLLQIYTAVMDAAERDLPAAELITFRTARRQDYNRMLVSECVDAAGNVLPEALRAVTEREITAGRMAADDDLRRLALNGPEASQPPSEPLRTGLRGLFSRGHRSK